MSAVNDIAQVRLFFTLAGQQMECGFGFRCLNVAGTLANLASDFKTAMVKNSSGGLLYPMTDDTTSSSLRVMDVKPGTAAPYDYTYATVAGGETSSDPLPPQCAAVLTWHTAFSGRSYRGRTYLPGLGEITQVAGAWTSTYLTALGTIVTQMLAVFGPGGSNANWEFGVISRVNNGAPRPTPIETQITSGAVRTTVFTQRRRTIGVGA
jgi:hypothetical protein